MILILQRRKISMYRTGPTHEFVLYFEFRHVVMSYVSILQKNPACLAFFKQKRLTIFPSPFKAFPSTFFP